MSYQFDRFHYLSTVLSTRAILWSPRTSALQLRKLFQCKDCLVFTLGAERKLPCRSARRPRVRPLHFHPPSRLDHRRKTNRERITFHPTLTASRFPLFFLFVFLFSLSFRQRRSILSRSSTALVRPRTFSNTFLFILADILVTFFLQFSWTFGTTTTRLPTHPRHRSVYHRIRLPSVGTHVFKQPPRRGRH